MKTKFLLAALCATFAMASWAQAAVVTNIAQNELTFTVNGHNVGEQTYYNCDSVASYTEQILKRMGAHDVNVTCFDGGLELTPYPAVTATFKSLRLAPPEVSAVTGPMAEWATVTLKDFSNCQLARTIVQAAQGHFEISEIKGDRACSNSNSAYKYEMTLLLAN